MQGKNFPVTICTVPMFAGLRVCSVRGDYFFSNFRNEQKNKLFPSYQENDAVFVLVDLLAVSRVEEQI